MTTGSGRRRRVAIIYTGGTFGMRPSARGYVPAPDLRALLARKLPELDDPLMPQCDLDETLPPLDSANMQPEHWYRLAGRIAGQAGPCDGFVVIHGTDTLAYTASALSFLLRGQRQRVVLTGAQVPLWELRNDARGNLLAALQVAALDRPLPVSVCFGSRLLQGNRTTKVSASAFDAFDSPKFPAIASVGIDIRFRPAAEAEPAPGGETVAPAPLRPAFRPVPIAVLPLFPGLPAPAVDALVEAGTRGLVLECYGAGTAPDQDRRLLDALARAVAAGVVVVAISQCLHGGADLAAYAAGQALLDRGIIGGRDLTREAALTKLHYLFACDLVPAQVAELMPVPLCGELAPAG